MKLVAGLCWFREPLPFLDRLVRSLEGVVDELVAVDGGWQRFPQAAATSGREERDVIRAAAAEVGLPAQVIVPARVWVSQIEKRQAVADLCRERGGGWMLVTDGDWSIAEFSARPFRQSLELTGRDVATVMLRSLNGPWPLSETPELAYPSRQIYRLHDGLVYDRAHNGVRIGSRWLNGDPARVVLEPALDLSSLILVDHDNCNRPADRAADAKAFRAVRRREELESWR